METVTLDFEYTKRDYIRASRQQMFAAKSMRIFWKGSNICLGLLILVSVLVSVMESIHGSVRVDSTYIWLLFFFALYTLLLWSLPYRSYNRSAKRGLVWCHMEISPLSIFAQTSDSRTDSDWTAYREYWENREFFFLVQVTRAASFIPKRVFAPGQEEALRRILANALPYGEKRPKYRAPERLP